MSIGEGTECAIKGPTPFNKKMFYHKVKEAGDRYEMAVTIINGSKVWVNGPYKSGPH